MSLLPRCPPNETGEEGARKRALPGESACPTSLRRIVPHRGGPSRSGNLQYRGRRRPRRDCARRRPPGGPGIVKQFGPFERIRWIEGKLCAPRLFAPPSPRVSSCSPAATSRTSTEIGRAHV